MASHESTSQGFVSIMLYHDPQDASGASVNCADVFVVAGLKPDPLSIWTEPESGTLWPRDLVPKDPELKDLCRIWILTMHDVDANLQSFQECIPLQNFAFGSLNAIDRHITSDASSVVSNQDSRSSGNKKPNNGVVILIGHGLGGLLVEVISTLILELPAETLQGHHLGLKQKHWRLIVLGTPHLGDEYSNIIRDIEQITAIVAYYGGTRIGCDVHHTRGFWKGLEQHSRCLINGDWEKEGLQAPADSHGTLKVASFQEGEQDGSLAQQMKTLWPNSPETNGFVVQASYSLFGGKGLYGFEMSNPPSPVMPRKHKNMGQFKDESDPCYLSLRAVLKEFVTAEQGVV
ncbi:hypothetical protein QQX98_000967 [Neonectria punicea]|uniref:GPI inositol-deacylase n=1 Tax=Neonectria punicea TaxID=979145 RepID=A0ABR1HQK2_9HYPO